MVSRCAPLSISLMCLGTFACADPGPADELDSAATGTSDGSSETGQESGEGDGDGDGDTGDGDGGDGDGDGDTGDGDTGDGDGDGDAGDGDGDTGDGDGDALPPCEDLTMVSTPGEVFTPSPQQPQLELSGGPYPPLRRIEIDLDVHVGPFRDDPPQNPDPNWTPRWDHIIYELYRDNQAQTWERFLVGASGRIEADAADRAFNYGRVEIAAGAGSYISWKKPFTWVEDSDVHLRQWIDAELDEQTLEIRIDGMLDWTITGQVDYYDPALTTDGLYMHLGTIDADWGLHVSPYDWTFSNLRVCAWEV